MEATTTTKFGRKVPLLQFEEPPQLPKGYKGPRYGCRGPRVADEEGNLTAERIACGQELTALVLAAPRDGKEYAIPCPACGLEFTLRNTPEVS